MGRGRNSQDGSEPPLRNLSAHKDLWAMISSSLQSMNSYPEVIEHLEAGIKTIDAVNLSKYVSGMSIDIPGRFSIPIVQIPAAAYTIFLYDWALCFSEEIRLVFPAKWSLVKLLYLQVNT